MLQVPTRKPAEVMFNKKLVNKRPPVPLGHHTVPRPSHHKRSHHHLPPSAPSPPRKPNQRQRQHHRHQTLRQYRRPKARPRPPSTPPGLHPSQSQNHPRGKKYRQRHIRHGNVRIRNPSRACPEHHRPLPTPHHPSKPNQKHRAQQTQRQPYRRLRPQTEIEPHRPHPIQHRWLL